METAKMRFLRPVKNITGEVRLRDEQIQTVFGRIRRGSRAQSEVEKSCSVHVSNTNTLGSD